MYYIEVEFIKDLDASIKLSNNPIDGVNLYSNLDIIINCLQDNLIESINFRINTKASLSNESLETLKDKKEKFLSFTKIKSYILRQANLELEIPDMTDEKFHILAEAIKKSPQIKFIQLFLAQRLSPSQETDLTNAIILNPNIHTVIVRGFMSQKTLDAIAHKPDINLIANPITSGRNIQEARLLQNEFFLRHLNEKDDKEIPNHMNLYLAPILIGIFGTATMITAMLFVNSVLATLGTASLALSAYSLFKVNKTNNENHLTPRIR